MAGTNFKAMYQPIAVNAAINNGLDPNLFSALIESESSWNPLAKSSTSTASGLGQLLKGTAKDFGVTDVFDPVQNLNGAAAKLASTLKMYGNYPSAIASYKGIDNPSGLGATDPKVSNVFNIAGISPDYSANTKDLMSTAAASVAAATSTSSGNAAYDRESARYGVTPIAGSASPGKTSDKALWQWGLADWKSFFSNTAFGIVLFVAGLALIVFAIYAIVTRTKAAAPTAVSKLVKG